MSAIRPVRREPACEELLFERVSDVDNWIVVERSPCCIFDAEETADSTGRIEVRAPQSPVEKEESWNLRRTVLRRYAAVELLAEGLTHRYVPGKPT